jgi:hypothetical protein
MMAANVSLAVENGLNGVFISHLGWWERRGDLPGHYLMAVVVGDGGRDWRHAGCGWDAAGWWWWKETDDVAAFEPTLLDLGRRSNKGCTGSHLNLCNLILLSMILQLE